MLSMLIALCRHSLPPWFCPYILIFFCEYNSYSSFFKFFSSCFFSSICLCSTARRSCLSCTQFLLYSLKIIFCSIVTDFHYVLIVVGCCFCRCPSRKDLKTIFEFSLCIHSELAILCQFNPVTPFWFCHFSAGFLANSFRICCNYLVIRTKVSLKLYARRFSYNYSSSCLYNPEARKENSLHSEK